MAIYTKYRGVTGIFGDMGGDAVKCPTLPPVYKFTQGLLVVVLSKGGTGWAQEC